MFLKCFWYYIRTIKVQSLKPTKHLPTFEETWRIWISRQQRPVLQQAPTGHLTGFYWSNRSFDISPSSRSRCFSQISESRINPTDHWNNSDPSPLSYLLFWKFPTVLGISHKRSRVLLFSFLSIPLQSLSSFPLIDTYILPTQHCLGFIFVNWYLCTN